jgi:hypothetical protein
MANCEQFPDKDLPYELRLKGFRTAAPFYVTGTPSGEELDAHVKRVNQVESEQAAHLREIRPFAPGKSAQNFKTHRTIAEQSLHVLKEQGIITGPEPRANAE